VVVVGSSTGLSSHPFVSEQLLVPIASEVAHLPLPEPPPAVSEPTA